MRATFPVGPITVTLGTPLTSAVSLGSGPVFSDRGPWEVIMRQMDSARLAMPAEREAYWVGLLPRPTGFTSSPNGGFGYRPPENGSGPFTRVSLQLDRTWTAAADGIVAHEVGHNLGRMHAPCGNADGVDPAFPFPDGRLGVVQHDALGWAEGRATSAVSKLSAQHGDVMSWCVPRWTSAYTAGAILNWRGTAAALRSDLMEAGPVVVLRAHLADGRLVVDQVDVVPEGVPGGPATNGAQVEGVDADGRVLWRRPLTYTAVPDAGDFTVASAVVPLADWQRATRVRSATAVGWQTLRQR
jgi:hypothetical protein